jgi:phage terminase large subunit-like protein
VALRAWPHLARPKSTDARDTGAQWTVPHRDPARPDCVHLAVGRRGSLEGRPLDGVVLDDLYQSVADASSPANQRQVEDLLTTSVLGRVSSRGGFILDVGTRRGKRDTKGFWLRKADELRAAGLQVQIERWSYPLRGDEPWRYEGGYITPTWDAQTEQATRILMGASMARILLDCEDVDAVGDLFDLDLHLSHVYEIAPSRMAQLCGTTYLSIDTAETAGGGDWTVIQRWGRRNGLHHLLGQRRGQWDTLGVVREINAAIGEWKPQAAYIEATSAGKTALAVLGRAVQGCALVPVEASGSGSKLDRIRGILPLCALGQVLFPSPSCGEDVTWCYGLDAAGLDLRTRLAALRADRPDMRGEVDDEADAMQIYLRHAAAAPASAYPSRGQVTDMISRLRGGR